MKQNVQKYVFSIVLLVFVFGTVLLGGTKVYAESTTLENVQGAMPNIKNLQVEKSSPQELGNTIRWSVEAEGDGLEYAWEVYKQEEKVQSTEYSKQNYFNWIPPEEGAYKLRVFVRDQADNIIIQESEEYTIIPKQPPLAILSLTPSISSPQYIDSRIRWTVNAAGEGVQYAWEIYKGDQKIDVAPYDTLNYLDWTPKEPGSYRIQVTARDEKGNEITKSSAFYSILEKKIPIKILSLTSDKATPQKLGTKVRWTVKAEGKGLQYAWQVYKGNTKINAMQYSNKNYFDWTPKVSGSYKIQVFVKDMNQKIVSKTSEVYTINVVKNENQKLQDYINKEGFSSRTSYFIWVDLKKQRTYVFTGKKGNWKMIRNMLCATGKSSTPTIKGTFAIGSRGRSFGFPGGIAKNYVQIHGNYLFHSILFYKDGKRILDSTLGRPASHGCIRLSVSDSKWMYDTIPSGTKVVIR